MSSTRNLYFAASIACLTAALFGYSVGFIGGEIVLPSFLAQFSLDDLPKNELASARSWAVTAWIIGALIGVPTAMPFCERLGRKGCLQFAGGLYVVGAALELGAGGRLRVFDIGRLLNGMGVGAGTLVSPVYIAEISPPTLRGMLMSGYQVFVQAGALIGFWIAFIAQATLSDSSVLQWQIPVSLQLVFGGLLLLGTLAIPESPRYLAAKGRDEELESSLAWLRRLPASDLDLNYEKIAIMAAAKANQNHKSQPFIKELGKPDIRRRLAVGTGLMIAQNMVGLNALNYYAPMIFISAGFTSVSASLFLTGVFGVVKLVSALSFMLKFVHVRGNRFWLLLGSAICGVSMLVLACCVYALPPPSEPTASITAIGIVSVLMVYIFAFAFGVSLGPISWNVCSEIFPLHINSTCCAITTCTQWAFQIVIAAVTPPLLASVGYGTYLIYGGFCFLALLWVAFCVPETRGVGVGKPMDELFGASVGKGDVQAVEEISETSPLLVRRSEPVVA